MSHLAMAVVLAAVGAVTMQPGPAHAAASSRYRGVNWADQRDNFVNGVLYVSGLSASDTYTSAAATANQVVGQLFSITGANTVRLPVNEPTVAGYWGTYTGAIDTAAAKGQVILAYWAASGGKPANSTTFYQMWDTIIGKYGSNANVLFEVINEPHGYSTTDLTSMYATWLGRYPSVPRERVILDGAGLATNITAVGADSRLTGTLLGVHDYTMFVTPPYDSENQWASHLASSIGGYASRAIATEWGGPMSTGSKYDITWNPIDYSIPSGSWFADYIRGISSELRSLGIGSVYWPGLRDGDWYSLTSRTGTGANTRLTLVNASGLTRVQYAWGVGSGGTTTVALRNAATGQVADGLGSTANGASVGQGGDASSVNRQWAIENSGNYVRLRNLGTGLYLDGMGRTTSGADVGQYASSTSGNQLWSVVTEANNVRIRNAATGLFLDGKGATGTLALYSDTNSINQQWKIVATG
jgi:hypothetical protein